MSCMFTTAQVLSIKRNPVLKQSWIIHASQYVAEWNLFSWIRILPENEQYLIFVKNMCNDCSDLRFPQSGLKSQGKQNKSGILVCSHKNKQIKQNKTKESHFWQKI